MFRFKVLLSCLLVLSINVETLAFDNPGSRPSYLVDSMDEGELKDKLQSCAGAPFLKTDFSIAHRGAPLRFPEHTKESYLAAADMGAGIMECDVTFTRDRELVCRHSQCDLHTTTNILAVPELAAKCSQGFSPAILDKTTGKVIKPASAKCCTSDITVDEFLSLKGKRDAANPKAQTIDQYLNDVADPEAVLKQEPGTLMTHKQSIELFKSLGLGMTPELKAPQVDMPFNGSYSQKDYAQQMLDEYLAADVDPADVWPQSFNLADIKYWINNAPEFADQAVYLDGRYNSRRFNPAKASSWKPGMKSLAKSGVKIIAPPIWVLVHPSKDGRIVPSNYAIKAKNAGLDLISWSFERSGSLESGGGWYFKSVKNLINNDGDVYNVLDVIAKDVGAIGVFSDWPATVTYYANCMGIK